MIHKGTVHVGLGPVTCQITHSASLRFQLTVSVQLEFSPTTDTTSIMHLAHVPILFRKAFVIVHLTGQYQSVRRIL